MGGTGKTEHLMEQAAKVLEEAKARGIQSDFFFKTTFQRYMMQLEILRKLEAEIKRNGTMVKKEYVKGRKNVYTNPAIAEYNKTASAANGTVTTLINIIRSLTGEEQAGGKLQNLAALLGSDDSGKNDTP